MMVDDKTKRGPADPNRIDMSEGYEIRYWMEKLGCTKEQLVSAVGTVGPIVSKVAAFLKRK